MKSDQTSKGLLNVLLIGSADFLRRYRPCFDSHQAVYKINTSLSSEAWANFVSERPNLLVLEIGLGYSDKTHSWARGFLSSVRERAGGDLSIVLALSASEALSYGGDLLFESADSIEPSALIDSFIAQTPSALSSLGSVEIQISNILEMQQIELARRDRGGTALPALSTKGWVHSLADPKSRDLWMRWMPRYASYTNESPLIVGETGTGKTRLAQALHLLSGRSGPFISITPRDFSSSELIQAELFGAVAGAYTGAVDKWGLVKSAEKGTLFIDELQSIDKELQGKLITFIENKSYRRVGSTDTIKADVRFVFATNQPLNSLVENQTLREDFAYRLERVQLRLLPLRERRLDIASALAFALAKIKRERPSAIAVRGVTNAAYHQLFSNSWLGNLRQLENATAQLCELADMDGTEIINEQHVAKLFEGRLSSEPRTAAEVISKAAHVLANQALEEQISTLDLGLSKLSLIARQLALEISAGDSLKAADLIGENDAVLDLMLRTKMVRS